jgi:hypothetical protein
MGELERWSKRLLPNLPYGRIEQDTSFQNRITISAATGICSAGLSARHLRLAPRIPRKCVSLRFHLAYLSLEHSKTMLFKSPSPRSLLPLRKAPRTARLTACEPG